MVFDIESPISIQRKDQWCLFLSFLREGLAALIGYCLGSKTQVTTNLRTSSNLMIKWFFDLITVINDSISKMMLSDKVDSTATKYHISSYQHVCTLSFESMNIGFKDNNRYVICFWLGSSIFTQSPKMMIFTPQLWLKTSGIKCQTSDNGKW